MKSHLTMSCSQQSSSSPKHSKKRGVARRCCQVQGCNEDLTFSKEYHRKHKVCEKHSKSPKVVVGGLDQRFCQQCSRFHLLEEFDEGKRSCRKRLAGHNERRRKPPPLVSKSCSTLLLTSAFGHYQHNDVLLDGPSMFHSGRTSNPGWGNLKRLNTDYQGWSSNMKAENQMGRYNCGYAANTVLGNNGSNLLLHGPRMSTDLCNTDQCTPHSGVPMRHFLTSPISTKGDVNSSGVQDLSGIMDPGSALSLLSPHSWSSSEASGGPFEMNSSGSRALEHPMHQDQSSNSHPLSHDFRSNYGYVEDRMLPPSAYMLKNAEPTRYYETGLNSTDDKNLSGLRVPNINGVKVPMQGVFHGSLRNGEQACRVPMASSLQGYGGTMDSLSMHRKDGHL